MSRREYDRLIGPSEAEEDEGTARIVARSRAAVAAGRNIVLPGDVAMAIADGGNPIRVLRKWRGFTQADLALAAGLAQSYLSDLEKGRRAGPTDTMAALAAALGVPIDVLLP
jgi:DNA-binding XRE family transcriptional regulator